MKIHLTFDTGGDWVGVYVDEELVYEGHTIDEARLLSLLGIQYTVSEYAFTDGERCPQVRERQLELPEMEKEPA